LHTCQVTPQSCTTCPCLAFTLPAPLLQRITKLEEAEQPLLQRINKLEEAEQFQNQLALRQLLDAVREKYLGFKLGKQHKIRHCGTRWPTPASCPTGCLAQLCS
jgi:hypothetical protein